MNEDNLRVSVDPLKMKCAILGIKSKSGEVKKCLVMPIEDNDFYNKVGDDGKVTVRMTFDVWKNREVSQYGDTHMVKQSHSKEWNESHSDDDRKAEPILGNVRPIVLKTVEQVNVPVAEVVQEDDSELPF